MICAQTRVPGVSVSQVARRYSVNANQVFNWLKDPRFGGHRLRVIGPYDPEALALLIRGLSR